MKLSIIISNRNDIVMLNVTLNNAIEMLKTIGGDGEIVICDNSDQKFYELMPIAYPTGWLKRGLVRVFRQEEPGFTTARMTAAKEAKGEYIFCVDSHVLFGLNTLRDSVDFMDRRAGDASLGFGHPPIRWAHQGPAAIKHTLKVSDVGLPNGGWDCAYTKERKMFWKFMPWICRREWFLDTLQGYGTHAWERMSWGGAEELMQVKSLMLGYDNWAIATDPVAHIGPYTPSVVKTGQYKYRTYGAHGNFPHGFGVLCARYIVAGPELGYQLSKAGEEQFVNRHKIKIDDYWDKVAKVSHKEYEWLDKNKKYSYMELINEKPWERN
jgi:glycosyltransferase involved in cell wall biosynthesis